METMSKNAGTKVIFVDKNSRASEQSTRDEILEALEAHKTEKNAG